MCKLTGRIETLDIQHWMCVDFFILYIILFSELFSKKLPLFKKHFYLFFF